MRASVSRLVHSDLREALSGGAPTRSGRGPWAPAPSDRRDDGANQAVRPCHPKANGDGQSGDAAAHQGLLNGAPHCANLRAYSGQQAALPAKSRCGAVISACARDAASLAIVTRNLKSRKPAMDTCDSCWSSVPTTSSAHTAKTQPCEGGVSVWAPVATMHEDELWWPSPGNLQPCSIESGLHRRSTCRSTK